MEHVFNVLVTGTLKTCPTKAKDMLTIYVDADACPVKDEVYRVAKRYSLRVVVVANMALRVPSDPLIELVVRHEPGLNIVDDWIAEHSEPSDIVITADIPLAARCVAKQARVLDPKGRVFTEHDIGETLAMRDLLDSLRQDGIVAGGPAPMTTKDRSKFLSKLDELINAVRRAHPQQRP